MKNYSLKVINFDRLSFIWITKGSCLLGRALYDSLGILMSPRKYIGAMYESGNSLFSVVYSTVVCFCGFCLFL